MEIKTKSDIYEVSLIIAEKYFPGRRKFVDDDVFFTTIILEDVPVMEIRKRAEGSLDITYLPGFLKKVSV